MNRLKLLFLQIAKFSAVGTTCFFVDYGLMIFLTEATPMEYFSSCAVSFIVSTILNYILSMRFVFKGRDNLSWVQELLIFVFLSLVGLGINQIIMWVMVEKVRVFYMLSKIIAALIVSTFNFVSRKVFLE